MASRTGRGAGLVKQHQVAVHRFLERVAGRTGHILVAALERKRRLLVIEERWLPLVAVVATCAVVPTRAKLVRVRILVALAAGNRGRCELNVEHGKFHVRRLVAVGTSRGSMRAFERELRPSVVELRQILPFLGRVAGFAAQWLALGIQPRHALGELPFVNILVTTGAAEPLEVITRHLRVNQRLVAVVAGDGGMPSHQRPVGLLVLGQRVV